ncbi:diguanylate phosphodiesterase [Sphingomonas guangdongensis]|uniref:Diguanylate phosphodiesterase n=1 Tax=Sphingomonas guangdongensis TaxID=1141890 RepID=A0A285QC27_9SPHN|nr:EAL domain-containing protein [Sphingomonas guangdongensis]SOB79361.1 diguanylate phosphodiesterase [Sphingomonas guangdongensis]
MSLANLRRAGNRLFSRDGSDAPDDLVRRSAAKVLAWTTLATVLLAAIGFFEPIDDHLRMLRNMARTHPPSGRIVVVGIDQASVEKLGVWPWSRARHADLLRRVNAAGANRVFFDIFFHAPGHDRAGDRRFAEALKQAGNVWLDASYFPDGPVERGRNKLPLAEFRENAGLVSVAIKYSSLALVRDMPYATLFDGKPVQTMAAKLANVTKAAGETFPIDYAIDLAKIKTVSASDVINGRVPASTFRGRDVVVALASHDLGDVYFLPGRGLINGGYVNVLAAETLLSGKPVDLGWFWPLLLTALLAGLHVLCRPTWLSRLALAGALGASTVLPFFAEARLVFLDVVPCLTLVLIVAPSRAWLKYRRSARLRGNVNAVSGLPNLNALRDECDPHQPVLVGARIHNFAEISSSLPEEGEHALVKQIVARLELGGHGARIYQGDEGIFVWGSTAESAGPDQLDALHALFRSPALIDGRPIDLSVTFGYDAIRDRNLANRIGATLVAASEAAAEGLRWKAYDPAKLADAEWKLSLLGRLDAAIDSGEVWVAYQPQLDVRTGRLCGAEALVRWSHPEKGAVSPMEFVLAAEQHNRIDKLTAFVLGDAIKTAAAFQARGITFDVAVNISARLLERPGLVSLVRQQLADARLPPERLTLEVTESAALTSGRASIRTLEEIGSLGINVSIDDYGTGFSTLEYFKRIPATEVKIDRSFIAALDRNASDRLMVHSTIELAHSLGRTVVAEGVETPEILAELTNLECDKIQGYFIGKPMKLEELTKLIVNQEQAVAA